ncbi:hypothetical protein ACHAQA_004280 [Verticillium albo-atrum]
METKNNTHMKAVRATELNKPYTITNIPIPLASDMGSHDILLKVAVASYCHTDGLVVGGAFGTSFPCTASHEGAGTVVAAGSSSGFNVGDRVMAGQPLHPCGHCGDCLGPESNRQYCPNLEGHVGVHVDGCFAEYVRVDGRHAVKLPDEVSFLLAAPLACAGKTVWRGVLTTGLETGQWLAIVGSGGALGHLAIQFAKGRGLKVIGIDARDEGLELSKFCGADAVIDVRAGSKTVVQKVQDLTGGQGADATLVLSDADQAMAMGCAVTKMHGLAVEIAQPEQVKIPFAELVFRDIRVKGSLLASQEESRQMVEFVAKKGLHLESNVFHGLDSVHELVDLVHSGKMKGKAVMIVDQTQVDREKSV